MILASNVDPVLHKVRPKQIVSKCSIVPKTNLRKISYTNHTNYLRKGELWKQASARAFFKGGVRVGGELIGRRAFPLLSLILDSDWRAKKMPLRTRAG